MRPVALALAGCLLGASPAFAESQTIEIDPDAPINPSNVIIMKNAAVAAVLSAALPLAVAGASFALKPGPAATGLVIGAPLLSGAGHLYAGNPWRALSVGVAGPAFTAAGWGLGLAYARSQAADAAATATFAGNGLMWGFGLYTAWAAMDAYLSADLANKVMLKRAGVHETPQ